MDHSATAAVLAVGDAGGRCPMVDGIRIRLCAMRSSVLELLRYTMPVPVRGRGFCGVAAIVAGAVAGGVLIDDESCRGLAWPTTGLRVGGAVEGPEAVRARCWSWRLRL